MSDEELVLVQKESGKSSYARELFNRYLPLIYGVCLNDLKDADEADDAVKQIFNDLLNEMADNDITAFRPWIYRYTKNHCLLINGKEKDTVPVDFDEQAAKFNKIPDLWEKPDDQQAKLLASCLEKMPEQQRVSINYFFRDKLSYAEISDKVGYTLKHVKNYIQQGKQNLIICLENNDK